MRGKLIIIGTGGHSKVVFDIARHNGYTDISFLDDKSQKEKWCDCPVLGIGVDAKKYPDAEFIVAIGNVYIRKQIQEGLMEQGLQVATLIHPRAVVAADTVIGEGSVVVAGAVINPGAVLGKGVIVNTNASVDHDCRIGNYVHIAVGANITGSVAIGECTCIGAGAVVINNLSIAASCTIGAGAVVVKNIEESGIYIGVPARKNEDFVCNNNWHDDVIF